MDGGWWEGTFHGKRGVFPDNFVKVVEKSAGGPPPPSSSEPSKKEPGVTRFLAVSVILGSGAKRKRCRVEFEYDAAAEDELSLAVGDVVDVLACDDPDWWEGTLNGKRGAFPSNFVKMIEDDNESAEAPAAPAPAADPAPVKDGMWCDKLPAGRRF